MDNYFVQVTNQDGSLDKWVQLSQVQANYIYAEQVDKFGMNAVITGREG
tara:strand:+ start:259 stop:405 length:147 start_codon:yes stop_codon:yes gene_type:complete